MNPNEELEFLKGIMNNSEVKIDDPEWKEVQSMEKEEALKLQQLIYRYQQGDEREREIIKKEVEKVGGLSAVQNFLSDVEEEFVPKSKR